MGGNSLLWGWNTVEGPLAQGVNRGSPSETKGDGGSIPLLEVWLRAFMLQFCLFILHLFLFVPFSWGVAAVATIMLNV